MKRKSSKLEPLELVESVHDWEESVNSSKMEQDMEEIQENYKRIKRVNDFFIIIVAFCRNGDY